EGWLDPGFGNGGTVETSLGTNLQAIVVGLAQQPDGKLVAGASTADLATGDGEFVAARYTADGVLDPTFGTGGIARTSFPPRNGCEALGSALTPDGMLVVAGMASAPDRSVFDFALARFQSDGSLDTSFGDGGRVVTEFPDSLGSGAQRRRPARRANRREWVHLRRPSDRDCALHARRYARSELRRRRDGHRAGGA